LRNYLELKYLYSIKQFHELLTSDDTKDMFEKYVQTTVAWICSVAQVDVLIGDVVYVQTASIVRVGRVAVMSH